jgi:hypothetical protein
MSASAAAIAASCPHSLKEATHTNSLLGNPKLPNQLCPIPDIIESWSYFAQVPTEPGFHERGGLRCGRPMCLDRRAERSIQRAILTSEGVERGSRPCWRPTSSVKNRRPQSQSRRRPCSRGSVIMIRGGGERAIRSFLARHRGDLVASGSGLTGRYNLIKPPLIRHALQRVIAEIVK